MANHYSAHIPREFFVPNTFIAIDFETATKSRMACQLGVVTVENGEIVDRKEFLIQPPGNKYDEQNIRIHNISPQMTASSPTFDKIWAELKPIFKGQTIVSHSADFDIDVLYKNIDIYNLQGTVFQKICTCKLLGNATLYSACRYFCIELASHHNALSDAEACAKLLLECGKHAGQDITIPKLQEEDLRKLSSDVKKQNLESCTNKNTVFYNQKVVITGIFDEYPKREDLAQILKNFGADINGSISKKTNIVVIGKGAGPKKLEKIEEINSTGGYSYHKRKRALSASTRNHNGFLQRVNT